MTPEGHSGFKGQLNEEIEVALEHEGFYGIKCSPHYAMGLVIKVGEGALPVGTDLFETYAETITAVSLGRAKLSSASSALIDFVPALSEGIAYDVRPREQAANQAGK
jgi:hypothetical protein